MTMTEQVFDLEKYAACARRAAAEGVVLLKNDGDVLPLAEGTSLALFGRGFYNYYKSGVGSGGLVNAPHVVSIYDALRGSSKYKIDETLDGIYRSWIDAHPFAAGMGWGDEPWYQEEMPLDDEVVDAAAKRASVALVTIARTAGEDIDNKEESGSFLLTDTEKEMLRKVCAAFDQTVVLLNVGNIIDMRWVREFDPSAVLYVWQGGQEGGLGVLDVLDGSVPACGKLSDTIAECIGDYPSTRNHGDPDRNFYQEDIYVGYRYFETFCPEKVLYPFGYGLTYSKFAIEDVSAKAEEQVIIDFLVKNTGAYHGKEVIQLYVKKPEGKLGQPVRALCGYVKTRDLLPQEAQKLKIFVDLYTIASYDDSGCTGHKSCYVLEEGDYEFYLGSDVRSAALVCTLRIPKTQVVQKLDEAMKPVRPFMRFKAENGKLVMQPVPLRSVDPMVRRNMNLPKDPGYTGDTGLKLSDVRDGKASMEAFIAQLSDEDLCCIHRGEGMGSPKVTPGTGGAFGGVTERLKHFGIPIGCCSDGPSGIRMDCGTKAFSLPNGTCLACSFNDELNRALFEFEALELRKNKIDVLLGPGMNIHRNPLNGRNFEYFSEDPYLTGKIAAAQLKGLHQYKVTGTIKHFACNNQEYRRNYVDAIVSERALREIYLKGFEIAVKEAGAYAVMTTYCPVNGIYTSSNYDLLTTILRGEWGFTGIVMTDWWAKGNEEGEIGDTKNTPPIIRAQNDLYMVTGDAALNTGGDRTMEGLNEGRVTRGELARNAANICGNLLRMPAMWQQFGEKDDLDEALARLASPEDKAMTSVKVFTFDGGYLNIDPALISMEKGATNLYQLFMKPRGFYKIVITCQAKTENPLAQMSLSVFQNHRFCGACQLSGADTSPKTFEFELRPAGLGRTYLKLFVAQAGIEIQSCEIFVTVDMEEEIQRRFEANH